MSIMIQFDINVQECHLRYGVCPIRVAWVSCTDVVIEWTSPFTSIYIPKGGQAGRAGGCFGRSNVDGRDVGHT